LRLMAQSRCAIESGTFASFKDAFIARYTKNEIQ
jgi:queuine/archaeosine tRNA-ribosyltransferase